MWFSEFYGDIEMCTLMEKDALIELASDVQAYMARHNTTTLMEWLNTATTLKIRLTRTSPTHHL